MLAKPSNTIRTIARLLGKCISLCPAVQFGPLYFRHLERAKTLALKMNRGNFEKNILLANEEHDKMFWWIENVGYSYRPIRQTKPDVVIETDASTSGWGAVCNHVIAAGFWALDEQQVHIHYLEMLAIFRGLRELCDKNSMLVCVMSDNTTAVMC